MLWYTVGRVEDMSSYGPGVTNVTGSAYAKYAPYYGMCLNNSPARKDLDTPLPGIYVSFDSILQAMPARFTTQSFQLLAADLSTVLFALNITNAAGLVTVYANGNSVGTFALNNGATVINRIEIHFVPDAIAGIAQIWLNGTLVINFNGNTGVSTTPIASVVLQGVAAPLFQSLYQYISNLVISDSPIGNKIPIYLSMVDTATVAAGVQLATPGSEYLADVVDLPALPVVSRVTSVRIAAQIISGDGVSHADWELNVDGTTTAVTQSLPTTSAYKSAQIEGNWTPAQINGAKIGMKAEA